MISCIKLGRLRGSRQLSAAHVCACVIICISVPWRLTASIEESEGSGEGEDRRALKYARATPSQQALPGLRACGQHHSGRSRLPGAGSAPAAEVSTRRRRHRRCYIVNPHSPRGRRRHPADSAASPPGAVSLPWRRPVTCHARTRPRARAQCTRTQALSRGKTRRARPPAPGP